MLQQKTSKKVFILLLESVIYFNSMCLTSKHGKKKVLHIQYRKKKNRLHQLFVKSGAGNCEKAEWGMQGQVS